MPSNRKCAYCGSEEELTREHVLPKFVYLRDERRGDGMPISPVIREGKEKFVQSEITVADVCACCNSGFLSALDAYGAKLYDKFFEFVPQPGESIEFEYDLWLFRSFPKKSCPQPVTEGGKLTPASFLT